MFLFLVALRLGCVREAPLRHYFPCPLRAALPAVHAKGRPVGQVWGDTGPQKQRQGQRPARKGHSVAEGLQLQAGLCGPTADLSKHSAPLHMFILLCWALIPILKAEKLRLRGVKVIYKYQFEFRLP